MSSGCVITDPPQFQDPTPTIPFLILPDPDPGKVVVVDSTLLATTNSEIDFSAEVMSQDDPADAGYATVTAHLFIDYGYTLPNGNPYRYDIPNPYVSSGTIDQTSGRRARFQWFPSVYAVDPGCHTATMVVSHKFDDFSCPTCDSDSSAITWQILRCDATQSNCDDLALAGCQALTNTCAKARAARDAGSSCQPTDAGAQ